MTTDGAFRVGVSRDFLDGGDRNVWGDIGLDRLTAAGIGWSYLPEDVDTLRPADLHGLDAVLFAGPAVTAATFDGPGPFPRLLARFGVGYDAVDLDACTAHDCLVTITPDGARRSVATAALTLVLAARHHVVAKDRIARGDDWSPRTGWMGRGLHGRTVGLVGLGNAGAALVALLAPFECRVLASDPHARPERAAELGVTLCDLPQLFTESEVVVVLAALTPQTRGLIGAELLRRLPAGACLVNVARGPIVDEAALIAGLREGRPATAGLDVFEREPLSSDSPLTRLDNVVLSPHSLAWTDEMAAGNGASAVRAILDVRNRRVPPYVVNHDLVPTLLDRGWTAAP